MARFPDGAAGLASSPAADPHLSPRSILVARSDASNLSAGAIAGVVIGSVIGAILVAICAWPCLVRARRKARGGPAPFDPAAEMEAAQAAQSSSGMPTVGDNATKRLSIDQPYMSNGSDHTASLGHRHQSSRDYDDAASKHFAPAGPTCSGSYVYFSQGQPAVLSAPVQDGTAGHQLHQGSFVQEPAFAHGAQRAPTFGTLTTMNTTGTTTTAMGNQTPPASPIGGRHSARSSISKVFQSATSVFRKTSTRSIPNSHNHYSPPADAVASNYGDPTMSLPPTAFLPVDNRPPITGEAASYYSNAPMSPAMSAYSPPPQQGIYPFPAASMHTAPGSSSRSPFPHVPVEYQPSKIVPQQQQQPPQSQLFPPLDVSPMSPTSPGSSPRIKEEVTSEDEYRSAVEQQQSPQRMVKRMTFPKPQDRPQIGVSPTLAGPGTVNPMDIMAPMNASERSWQVQNELVKIEQTTPPPFQPNESVATPQPQQPLQQAVQSQPPAPYQQQGMPQPQQAQLQAPFNPTPAFDYASPMSMPDDGGDGNGQVNMPMDVYLNFEDSAVDSQFQGQAKPAPQPQWQQYGAQIQQWTYDGQAPQQTYNSTQQPPYDGQSPQLINNSPQQHPNLQGQAHNNMPEYPQTPTHIKKEPEQFQYQLQTPTFDLSDRTTPLQAASAHSTGLSNANTPNTQLTEPVSGYATTPGSNFDPSPGPNSGSDASPMTFQCEDCSRVFEQIHKLNHHRRYHEKKFSCTWDGCDMKFGTKTHLDRHVNDKHEKLRKYHCTVDGCQFSRTGNRSFPRKDNWRRHMQNKHNLDPNFDPPEVNDRFMAGV